MRPGNSEELSCEDSEEEVFVGSFVMFVRSLLFFGSCFLGVKVVRCWKSVGIVLGFWKVFLFAKEGVWNSFFAFCICWMVVAVSVGPKLLKLIPKDRSEG